MLDIFAQVVPIALLIMLGKYLNKKEIFQQKTIDQLKQFILNFSLSAILFITFLNLDLKSEYFLLFFLVFILLIVLFAMGFLINCIKAIQHPLIPFVTSGFSFGLLGIPLFSTVFGIENIGKLSILGIGHEIFIWLIFFTYLKLKFKNEPLAMRSVIDLLTSPLIISIFLGIGLNIAGWGTLFQDNMMTQGIYQTLEYLAGLGTPLILIIIGYGLEFHPRHMKQSAFFLLIRALVIGGIGILFKKYLIDAVISPDVMFDHAYFTFLILPPPLSLPILVGYYGTKEQEELINNTVVLGTVVSISLFVIYLLVSL